MNKTITTLNADVIASTLINNWGSECINKTDGDIPVGVGVSDGNENIFSYDDAYDVSGYMYLNDLNDKDYVGAVIYEKEVIINVFQKKDNDSMDDYQTAIDLHSYLNKRKYDVTLKFDKSVKCEFCYFCSIVVTLKVFPTC